MENENNYFALKLAYELAGLKYQKANTEEEENRSLQEIFLLAEFNRKFITQGDEVGHIREAIERYCPPIKE